MTDNEKFYDEEIAPLIKEIAEKCNNKGMSVVCAVEYNPNEIGRTQLLQKESGLEIVMAAMCTKTAPNVDAYMIGLTRYCYENDIDIDSSIYLNKNK